MLVAKASLGWMARDLATRDAVAAGERAAREAALDAEVARSLDEAVLVIDGVRWVCWRRRPRSDAPKALREAAGRTELPPRLLELQRDLTMLRRLEEVTEQPYASLKHAGVISPEEVREADSAYGRAFKDYGIDIFALTVEDAVARIRHRSIRFQLACALDFWASKRRSANGFAGYDADWRQPLHIAKAADPDPWRVRLRDTLLAYDPLKGLNPKDKLALEGLAATANPRTVPPATLLLPATPFPTFSPGRKPSPAAQRPA